MSTREGKRPAFGRIDPFCLLAVVPTLLVAALMAAQGLWLIGLGCVAFAGLILLFDSWVNRPEPAEPAPADPAPAAPVRRPARPRAAEQAPRPPQRQPPRRPDQRNLR